MILRAFALLDVKAGAFATPFFMHHDAQAIRAVTELAQDQSTTVARYPSDFALCRLGTFDDASGVLTPQPVENLGVVAGFLPAPRTAMPLFEGQVVPRLNGAHPAVDANGETM